jgi:hypothetical protein
MKGGNARRDTRKERCCAAVLVLVGRSTLDGRSAAPERKSDRASR